ncbi:hypothetical protein TKK_0015411 [Trichogramma kaykai]|uniref:Mutator-like transposase domain-containing protein n=1 Tax=Trichogramma kaykai TaxID=54128 RepID=A0ABD2WAC3_9HYME
MELPRPIFQSFYDKVVKHIQIASEEVSQDSIMRAAKEKKYLAVKDGEKDGITVSGDGTWRKRGFFSLYGIVTLIGYKVGKIVDYTVQSKYCKACEYWKKHADSEKYAEWLEAHKLERNVNHEGSSGKMEIDSAVEMFKRSEKLHKVRYAKYIGDGDAKTFKGIIDSKPYKKFNVVKKECVDHVQKRMGTRLRNLNKNNKGLAGKGKLTGKLIDELSIYYGLAIRRNSDSVEKMKNEIWASIFHKLSTDDEPQHDRCPPGEDSWYSWQQAKATNSLDQYTHKPALSDEVFEAIKPIYEDLSSEDLLTRCTGGYTQNNNECFNSTVWALAPKTMTSGKTVPDMATNIAVSIYNDGFSTIMSILEVMGMKIRPNSYNFCLEVDAKRIEKAENSLSEAVKEARIMSRSTRKNKMDENFNLEGQLYGAGIAD